MSAADNALRRQRVIAQTTNNKQQQQTTTRAVAPTRGPRSHDPQSTCFRDTHCPHTPPPPHRATMPPRRAPKPTLASHLASSPFSSSDDDELPQDTKPASRPAASVESSAVKKSRGRPRKQSLSVATPNRANEVQIDTDVTMSKTKPQSAAKPSARARASRTADTPRQPAAETGTKRKKTGPQAGLAKIEENSENDEPDADVPPAKRRATKTTRAAAPGRKKAADLRAEIPETQVDSRIPDEDVSRLSDEQEDEPPARSRKPAAADEIADVKAELEQLRARYNKLRHLKTDQAESIQKERVQALQEQDKGQSPRQSLLAGYLIFGVTASQRIIESLRAQLEAKDVAHEAMRQKDARVEQLERENAIMEKKIERLVQDHAILSAKLETARNQAKPASTVAKANGAAAFSKEFSQHRDNLYSDLCGLIVLNVKNDEDGGIEYDCLSTGRNGALHFKLQLDAEDEDEDEEDGPYFTYNPMLERGRDERLLAVLPPIFRDEMNFKRTRGVDFYLQLMQSLQVQ
ncbi:hypothetical protein Dda_6487 [Drechslerella dactyloides]|uniref:Monopolin complex subunit Csm1/Pcs1 C-terminal domain-containing protein n=1 Tax=Drechslerella dactyloides TaxID=74499 RepID=A0AAD6NG84_DREDA|nr:hypothetical protein Dda_6487 [Drechslerella dactyloides]